MKRPFNRYGRALVCGVYFISTALPLHAAEPAGQPLTDRKRMVTKTFSVTSQDRLYVYNQFGEVRVNLWERNEVRAEVTIIGSGEDEDEAQNFLDKVEIRDSRAGNQVRIETVCGYKAPPAPPTPPSVWAWSDWKGKRAEPAAVQRGVRISYVLTVPRYLPLEMKAHFSNTIIASFSAPLIINSRYGNLSAGRLMGTTNDIRVQHGQANIKSMEKGRLDIEYSKLLLEKAEELQLENKHGELRLGEISNLIGDLSYCTGSLETLKESAQLRLQYMNNFRLPSFSKTLKNVDIRSKCSDIRLPLAEGASMDFDVTVNFAEFRYPEQNVQFDEKNEGDSEKGKIQSRKTYKGRVGKGGGNVRIVCNYGTLRIGE
ncbi:MAG: hypothetical protein H7Y12_14785 [Sphingobacteriaceae bacterium]|nr:hypothetical protein [Cytophagaceae bacterium]